MRTLKPQEIFTGAGELSELVDRFRQARIAIVGDFFLDQYLIIDPKLAEPSVETGLTANQVIGTRQSPGAAGTVTNNLSALEAGELFAVGVIGDDGHGYVLRRELETRGVQTQGLIVSSERFTPTYTKPMFLRGGREAEGERIDIINRTPTPRALEEAVLRQVEEVAAKVDAVILLDQVVRPDVGVLTARVRDGVSELAQRFPKTIFYADSRGAIGLFKNVLAKPNEHEALFALGETSEEPNSDERIEAVGQKLFARIGRPVFITRGDRGMLVTTEAGQSLVPGIKVSGPLDICGAGDSATAGIVLSLCAGATPEQAALVGNIVASKTVVQIGTTGTTTRQAVKETSIF